MPTFGRYRRRPRNGLNGKEDKSVYDLIYAGADVEQIILSKYPEAKITDASDGIHTERFEMDVETEEDEFYPFAIKEGFARCCFNISMLLGTLKFPESKTIKPKESKAKLEKWIALAQKL